MALRDTNVYSLVHCLASIFDWAQIYSIALSKGMNEGGKGEVVGKEKG